MEIINSDIIKQTTKKIYLPSDQLHGIKYDTLEYNRRRSLRIAMSIKKHYERRSEFYKLYFKPIHKSNKLLDFSNRDSSALLQVMHLTKQYKRNVPPAIHNINFKVMPGEFHAFIGANGAGKTTTIKSIIGAYASYRGKIFINDYINHDIRAKRVIGYIPETARFPDGVSTLTYLVNMATISGMTTKQAKSFATKTLKEMHMSKLAKKSPNSFSSGQKKKVLLAQALVHNPKLIIMDEPAANLDPKARIEFFETLKKLQHEGKSIFISSHILAELDRYATHTTILDGGKVVFTGDVDIYKKNITKIFEIVVDDFAKLKKHLIKHNYTFHINETENGFLVDFKSIKESQKFLEYLHPNFVVLKFTEFHLSLENIYKKYVTRGSVHTMT